jgi:undecaprenyldiphospho-muramoylpentapeptide beta-N-acetylglucosaminyltransferase
MANGGPVKALLVAEGSGGHLVPALEVAHALAQRGVDTRVWYARRRQLAPLALALTETNGAPGVGIDPIPMDGISGVLEKLRRCRDLWARARRCFDTFAPDVVVGFGGWVSAPVVLAARLRRRRIAALLHEQNVQMGRANRWLARWVDRVALSFPETQVSAGDAPTVITGLPIRQAIGHMGREEAAQRLGMDASRPTLFVLGGSQGARAINRLITGAMPALSSSERAQWQWLHLTGASDEGVVRRAYASARVTAWIAPFLAQMDAAYALADLVIARAGASTIAELARAGRPAVLIPYPGAGGHQRANAQLVAFCGGGVILEESEATPARLLETIRRLMADGERRRAMGEKVRALDVSQATARLSDEIVSLAQRVR